MLWKILLSSNCAWNCCFGSCCKSGVGDSQESLERDCNGIHARQNLNCSKGMNQMWAGTQEKTVGEGAGENK